MRSSVTAPPELTQVWKIFMGHKTAMTQLADVFKTLMNPSGTYVPAAFYQERPIWLGSCCAMGRRTKSKIVYVDAKILNRDKAANVPKRAFVGYFVEGGGWRKAEEIDATQSFDAEVRAILFAIGRLKGEFQSMRIICDFQSVVSEAKRKDSKNRSPLLKELRTILEENKQNIRLEALKSNPAHKVVTEYVNKLKADGLLT